MNLSIKDNDNDSSELCAKWWKEVGVFKSYLNAPNYHGGPISEIIWYDWKGANYSLKFTEMNVIIINSHSLFSWSGPIKKP